MISLAMKNIIGINVYILTITFIYNAKIGKQVLNTVHMSTNMNRNCGCHESSRYLPNKGMKKVKNHCINYNIHIYQELQAILLDTTMLNTHKHIARLLAGTFHFLEKRSAFSYTNETSAE